MLLYMTFLHFYFIDVLNLTKLHGTLAKIYFSVMI